MMESLDVYAYQWQYSDDDGVFRVFALDADNRPVCVRVEGFTPYVYLELPPGVDWRRYAAQLVQTVCDGLRHKPVKTSVVYKRRLFYAQLDDTGAYRRFPYLMLAFAHKSHVQQLRWMKPVSIPGACTGAALAVHESDASPLLQLTCCRDVSPTGWITVRGTPLPAAERESLCDREYTVFWKNISPSAETRSVVPLVMSFDIECNSTNPAAMPDATKPGDKIFQISACLSRGPAERRILLSLGAPTAAGVGCEVRAFATEHELLVGYAELIRETRPAVVTGYNIFGFDIPYMIKRAKLCMCLSRFDTQGLLAGRHAQEKTITWSSSAFQDQHFEFLDVDGVVFVDLLPLVKRDYKLNNYRLATAAEHLLHNSSKDPLTPQDIFRCYREFTPAALSEVGKYCVQDAALVAKLFCAMQTWHGLCEMSKTCHVPIFTLYTQGQQIKVYSQVYRYCMGKNIVVEKDKCVSTDTYTGAYVVDPVPGVYNMVVPFDFNSLYPTTIIAYNIDYSTLVLDPKVPDSACHVVEWEDHVGCVHAADRAPENKVICARRRFRFLRADGGRLGVIPTIIQNLLQARKATNAEIRRLRECGASQDEIDVLDKRQLSYKVSANSMYGAMGVQRGYLPFMPGAMTTTALGRISIVKAAEYLQRECGAQLVYGDTDSTMVVFPETDPARLWTLCLSIEQRIAQLFPAPMKLAFEEKIYKRFFILTKKRYLATECGETGAETGKITKKGVLLARRDNSRTVRDIYEDAVMQVLATGTVVLSDTVDRIVGMFQRRHSAADYVITKGVKEIASYKVRDLPDDSKKRSKRLADLRCTETDYAEKTLPAHIQLVERMRRRGTRVDVGSRLEYVITAHGDKLPDKVEDVEYFLRHRDVCRIDYLYYLKLLVNPLDQVLDVVQPHKHLVAQLYKTCQQKQSVCDEIYAATHV